MAVYRYRPSSVVCRSVCRSDTLVSPAQTAEPIEMQFRLGYSLTDPHGKGRFWGEKGRPIVKYRDTLQSSVQNGRTDRDAIWVVSLEGP